MIRAVVFDIGETLVDESAISAGWADWLGVSGHTFSAVVGAVLARGGQLIDAFRVFRPDFDRAAEKEKRQAVGLDESFGPQDLYPDVRPGIEALRAMGLWVGVAGN